MVCFKYDYFGYLFKLEEIRGRKVDLVAEKRNKKYIFFKIYFGLQVEDL